MSLENWNEHTGSNWLKSENVMDENQALVCVNVEVEQEEEKKSLVLTLELEKKQYKFRLNVTNSNKCAEFVNMPKDLIGKELYFKKALVRNPNTNQEVESLRVYNVVE